MNLIVTKGLEALNLIKNSGLVSMTSADRVINYAILALLVFEVFVK